MDERERLAADMDDPELISYFYLDKPARELLDTLDSLTFSLDPKLDDMPFNAAVKGYQGATDSAGHPWIVKPAGSKDEIVYHRLCTLAYLVDHMTGTLAAPTSVARIDGTMYRVTKVVRHSIQISSYSYLDQPYIGSLRADLVNRWLYFDEDRNPNNYLVVHNRKGRPFVIAIDYDKADLASTVMKITGDPEKFGWFRSEKTRFLTLLRPSHFEGISIDVFDARLKAICGIPADELRGISRAVLDGYADHAYADAVTDNLLSRRAYIDGYFRRMFKSAAETVDSRHDGDYEAFGESFRKMYGDKN
ncbi:MAG: hypothetical protein NT080_09185 [Spirochaetes bacterium]|nr:hypothetical protein [Spirochaetota bacterium]